MQSQVDFGNVLANSKVIAREITLVNSGSKAGEFKISYPGCKPIAIIPNQGSVPPNSVQVIKVSCSETGTDWKSEGANFN